MAKIRQGRGIKRWIGLVATALLAITTTVVWGATAASAHHSDTTLKAVCAQDKGSIVVTLTIYNSQSASQKMTLKNVVATGFTAPVDATNGSLIDGGSNPGHTETFVFNLPVTNTGVISYDYDTSWANGETDNSNFASVKLPTDCGPKPGGFSVTKHVKGETDGYVPGSKFTVNYSCSNQATGVLTVADLATETVNGLPAGTTCTISEGLPLPATKDASYAYGTPYFYPSGLSEITVTIVENQVVKVFLKNPIDRVKGSFSVTKALSGQTAGYAPGTTFTVNYDCTDGSKSSFTLTPGQLKSVSNLPLGTQCTLTEGAKPGTTGPGYRYGTEVFSPSNKITISSATTVAVVLTDPLDKLTGGFTVTKAISGETSGHVAGSTFTVNYDCTDGSKGSLSVMANLSKSATGILAGSSCTLSEGALPATSGPSYAYGTPTFAPSNVVAVGAGANVQVTLTNPINRLVGSLSVTKSISGATAGYVAGSTFGFSVDCAGTEYDTTVSLIAGQTKSVSGIPLGTSCVVSESAVPAPVPGYSYGAPVVSPAGGSVVISSTTVPVSVSFDNPLVWLPKPDAKVVGDCKTESAIVTLSNKGGGSVVFTILVDGTQFGPTHDVTTSENVLVPLTEGVPTQIKVIAGGQQVIADAVITNDCEKPGVKSIAADCAVGGTVVTLTNSGVNPVDITVLKNGGEVDTVSVGSDPVDVLVPMDEDETATIDVKDGSTLLATQQITLDCQNPVVKSVLVVCAADGVVVTLTNSGVNPVDLTVYKDGEEVETVSVGATPVLVVVPFDEGETATVEVRDGDEVLDTQERTLDCQQPQVTSFSADCAEGGVLVTLTNAGEKAVLLKILKNGVEVASLSIGTEPVQFLVPFAEGETAGLEVRDGSTVLSTQELTADCQQPGVTSVAAECAEGGVAVGLANDGESPVDLTVFKNGVEVDTVTVGVDPVEVFVTLAEDETATIEVRDGDTVLRSEELTQDCEEPTTTTESTTTTTPSIAPNVTIPTEVLGSTQVPGDLPVTGANFAGVVMIGLGLLLGGAALIGISRRRSS